MRDLGKTIDYIERGLLHGLDRRAGPAPLSKVGKPPKPLIRAWRAPVAARDVDVVYPVEQVFRPKDKLTKDMLKDNPMARLTLTARTLKITVPLDAAEVRALPTSDETRSQLAITCEGKVYTADIATKSLRKAKASP